MFCGSKFEAGAEVRCSLSAVTGEKVGLLVSCSFLITTFTRYLTIANYKRSRTVASVVLSSSQSHLRADILKRLSAQPTQRYHPRQHVQLHLSTMAHTKPSPEETLDLFKDIESSFPSATLGDDKWYILAVSLPPARSIVPKP